MPVTAKRKYVKRKNVERQYFYTMSAREICDIIKECKAAGVHYIRSGDVELSFAYTSSERNPERQSNHTAGQPPTPFSVIPAVETPLGASSESVEAEAIRSLELSPEQIEAYKELQRSQLLIDDPLTFEETMIDEDLEHARMSNPDADI